MDIARTLKQHSDVVMRMTAGTELTPDEQKPTRQNAGAQLSLRNVARWTPQRTQGMARLIQEVAGSVMEFTTLTDADSASDNSKVMADILNPSGHLTGAVALSVSEDLHFTPTRLLQLKLQVPPPYSGYTACVYFDLLDSGRLEVGKFQINGQGEIEIVSDLSTLPLAPGTSLPLAMIQVVLVPPKALTALARFVLQSVRKAPTRFEWKFKAPKTSWPESRHDLQALAAHRLSTHAPDPVHENEIFHFVRLASMLVGVSYSADEDQTVNVWIRLLHDSPQREPIIGSTIQWIAPGGEGPSDVTNANGDAEFPGLTAGTHVFHLGANAQARIELAIKI